MEHLCETYLFYWVEMKSFECHIVYLLSEVQAKDLTFRELFEYAIFDAGICSVGVHDYSTPEKHALEKKFNRTIN